MKNPPARRQPARKAQRRTAQRRTAQRLTAASADKHLLYQQSVQDPATEVRFVLRTFRSLRGRRPLSLREDFCGTALFCAEWVKGCREGLRCADGVDIDPEVLEWAARHNLEPLGDRARRVRLLRQDVRDPAPDKYDVVLAFNFSYWIFKSRTELRDYFRTVRRSLRPDGVFFLDAYGGWEAHQPMLERRRIGRGVTYVWDQDVVDPINGRLLNHIHYQFSDGTELRRAFTYDWRFWSLPEITELLQEAGFGTSRVYWDVADEDDETEYRPRRHATSQPGWLAYVVACR